jgi:hypothetical protein
VRGFSHVLMLIEISLNFSRLPQTSLVVRSRRLLPPSSLPSSSLN